MPIVDNLLFCRHMLILLMFSLCICHIMIVSAVKQIETFAVLKKVNTLTLPRIRLPPSLIWQLQIRISSSDYNPKHWGTSVISGKCLVNRRVYHHSVGRNTDICWQSEMTLSVFVIQCGETCHCVCKPRPHLWTPPVSLSPVPFPAGHHLVLCYTISFTMLCFCLCLCYFLPHEAPLFETFSLEKQIQCLSRACLVCF